jgi:hypothetical protein
MVVRPLYYPAGSAAHSQDMGPSFRMHAIVLYIPSSTFAPFSAPELAAMEHNSSSAHSLYFQHISCNLVTRIRIGFTHRAYH